VLIAMFLYLRNVGWTWILAIPILLGTMLFAQGIGLVLSIINARFGDVMYIVAVVLGALYFLTPVLYPISMVEGQNEFIVWVIKVNPMSWYVQSMHDVMYSLVAPSFFVIAGLVLFGIAVFWAGLAVFNRWSEDIGELL
jgi:ABC-type polysaccharide/polyol phosphate export permease